MNGWITIEWILEIGACPELKALHLRLVQQIIVQVTIHATDVAVSLFSLFLFSFLAQLIVSVLVTLTICHLNA